MDDFGIGSKPPLSGRLEPHPQGVKGSSAGDSASDVDRSRAADAGNAGTEHKVNSVNLAGVGEAHAATKPESVQPGDLERPVEVKEAQDQVELKSVTQEDHRLVDLDQARIDKATAAIEQASRQSPQSLIDAQGDNLTGERVAELIK